MALYTPGPMAGQISGRIGATIFSHNRGGTYCRNGTIPHKVITDPAIRAKNRMKTIIRQWKTLTPEDRLAWETYCANNPVTNRLGNKITLSPHMAYSGINCRLDVSGCSQISHPPISPAPAPVTAVSAVCSLVAGTCLLTFAPTPVPVGIGMWLDVAVVDSAAHNYVENLWKFCGMLNTGEVTGLDIKALIIARFGTLLLGQIIHIRVSSIGKSTGLLSGPIQTSTTVVA